MALWKAPRGRILSSYSLVTTILLTLKKYSSLSSSYLFYLFIIFILYLSGQSTAFSLSFTLFHRLRGCFFSYKYRYVRLKSRRGTNFTLLLLPLCLLLLIFSFILSLSLFHSLLAFRLTIIFQLQSFSFVGLVFHFLKFILSYLFHLFPLHFGILGNSFGYGVFMLTHTENTKNMLRDMKHQAKIIISKILQLSLNFFLYLFDS